MVRWLGTALAAEFVVRVQERGISSSSVITIANRLKLLFCLILVGLAVYWAWLSHWLFRWDTFDWIACSSAIEMNISK
ncbi:MAG: hypothetical protein KJP16_06045 [Gammaproteobacteria bacterium]|nr:hypothetical protein [Gammaproteobacteria bacterium]NNL50364.1 hypothetical protein [Woeseiaceae bacterium]